MRRALLAAVALVAASGCNATYAPPVRGTHYGAPARLAGRRVEVGGAAAGVTAPAAGGPHVALGLEDWVSIEAGANLNFLGPQWAMGWLGARFTRAPEHEIDFVGDLELGVGAGAGGASNSGGSWFDNAAGGGYAGLGGGVRVDFVTFYLRSRVEVTAATGSPVTFWPTALAGIDFTIDRTVALGVSGGYLGVISDEAAFHGGFYQLQVALLFDLPRPVVEEPEEAREEQGAVPALRPVAPLAPVPAQPEQAQEPAEAQEAQPEQAQDAQEAQPEQAQDAQEAQPEQAQDTQGAQQPEQAQEAEQPEDAQPAEEAPSEVP